MLDLSYIQELPLKIGVYLMKDKKGEVLYVGKAKNLRSRVRQYFISSGDERAMVPILSALVHSIETIVVFTEKEALLLERELIRKYKPKYNVLLKDDKSYLGLKLDLSHAWPSLNIVRYDHHIKSKKSEMIFGPYTSAKEARGIFDLIGRLFPLRRCSDLELVSRKKPCILYQMHRCLAPCMNYCSQEQYAKEVKEVTYFLEGKNKEVLEFLAKKMEKASEDLDFERAQEYYEMIQNLKKSLRSQAVYKSKAKDMDVIGLEVFQDKASVSLVQYRMGQMRDIFHFYFHPMLESKEKLIEDFILQYYETVSTMPQEIVVPISLENKALLIQVISELKQKKIFLHFPQKGEKKKKQEMAMQNASLFLERKQKTESESFHLLAELQKKMELKNFPWHIECLDNSAIQGKFPCSSVVVFENGLPQKKEYRRFNIKTVDKSDDYAMMKEVLYRRLKKQKEMNRFSDLIIIDGGRGHLNLAKKILIELDIATIDLIACAKEESRHDKGQTEERFFTLNQLEPIVFSKNSPILYLLQRIRDEAHRFAIEHYQKRHQASYRKSILDEIPCIGIQRKKALLKHFKSVGAIAKADIEEICLVTKVSKKVAHQIVENLKNILSIKSKL